MHSLWSAMCVCAPNLTQSHKRLVKCAIALRIYTISPDSQEIASASFEYSVQANQCQARDCGRGAGADAQTNVHHFGCKATAQHSKTRLPTSSFLAARCVLSVLTREKLHRTRLMRNKQA